jgi:transposase
MSLIHACQLCGANSFDSPIELQRHAQKLAAKPAESMPWNYRETLERIVSLMKKPQR